MGGVTIRLLTAGSGAPVVLIHGLGNSIASWRNNIGPLSKSFRVYAVDLPGHGLSTGYDRRYNLSYGAKFMTQLLDSLGLSQVSLAGSSLGGLVAMKTALDLPDKIDRLVLVGSAGLGRELALFLRLLTLPGVGELMSRPSRRKTRWTLERIIHDHSLITESLLGEVHQYRAMPGVSGTMLQILRTGATIRGQKDEVILLNQLESLNMPVLIAWGVQDRILPVRHAYRAHEHIKGSRLHIFQECGHWPQLEKSEEFNTLVEEFLREPVDSTSSRVVGTR